MVVIPTLGNVINNGANVVPLSNGDNTLHMLEGEVILNQQQQALAGGSRFLNHLVFQDLMLVV
jgi:hypothetical protein